MDAFMEFEREMALKRRLEKVVLVFPSLTVESMQLAKTVFVMCL